MTGKAPATRGRGRPEIDLIAHPHRFAAVFAKAAIISRLVSTDRQASLLAAIVFAENGTLGPVKGYVVERPSVNVAGKENLRKRKDKHYNLRPTLGRSGVVENKARSIREYVAWLEATPNAAVWRDKCAKWLAVMLTATDQRTFDFAVFNLTRLGFDRAVFERIQAAFLGTHEVFDGQHFLSHT